MTLQEAIAADDVNKLYSLIELNEKLLDDGSKGPFPNTPLHDAAGKGKTKVAMEIAILKPSFARKLNRKGYSPMHLALQNKHYGTVRALMTLNSKLIRVRGRGGITPLHFVAMEKGHNVEEDMELLEILAEFLYACKSSIEDLTNQCETAVHVAVKRDNIQAFEVLFGWLNRVYLKEILDWKDEDGNTVLHIAVLAKQAKIVRSLIGQMTDIAKNNQGLTALQIFQDDPFGDQDLKMVLRRVGHVANSFHPTLPLSQFLRMELTIFQKSTVLFGLQDESARDIILIMATLMATTTYQATLSPPGGYWQDNSSNLLPNSTVVTANSSGIAIEKPHRAGNIIMNGTYLYMFTVLNSAAFLASIGTVWVTAIPRWPHTYLVYISVFILCVAYFTSIAVEFPKSNLVMTSFLAVIYVSLAVAVLWLPFSVWRKHHRVLHRIDARWRHLRV